MDTNRNAGRGSPSCFHPSRILPTSTSAWEPEKYDVMIAATDRGRAGMSSSGVRDYPRQPGSEEESAAADSQRRHFRRVIVRRVINSPCVIVILSGKLGGFKVARGSDSPIR